MRDVALELVRSPWKQQFLSFLASVREDLFLASPYIGRGPLQLVAEQLSVSGALPGATLALLTDLSVGNMASGGVDAQALVDLVAVAPAARVYHLPGLHAKVYVADHHTALVTSANLTEAGLARNTEYGVEIRLPALVRAIKEDGRAYARLGTWISPSALSGFASAAAELVGLRDEVQRSATRALQEAFRDKLAATQEMVLERRADGETTHAIFARTVLYILRRGPMATREIHLIVQSIHPDLCDDSVDRVIGGVHFGKRWKHHVRNAQVFLRRAGLIALQNGRWALTEEGRTQRNAGVEQGW